MHSDHLRQRTSEALHTFRRQSCADSPAVFAQTYLAHHFKVEPSPMHGEIFELLQQATTQRGAKLAIAAPRGHAKSTIVALAHLLWSVCYRREPFIVLISNTLDQASDSLAHIKAELCKNPRLIEDFPEVCDTFGSSGGRRWTRDEIITANDVKITALGADKKIRGRRHGENRPTLIVLDDIENEAEVRSDDQRRGKAEWFNKAVLKAGTSTTNVFVVGTILHYDALLANLLDPRKTPGWESRKFQAVLSWSTQPELWERWEGIYYGRDEWQGSAGPKTARQFFESHRETMLQGTDVLWPQREDYYQLMTIRASEGHASFDSEKQNEPVNPADCYFQEGDFQYWDDEYTTPEALIASVGARGSFYGACDPSLGRLGKKGDYTAIITLLRDADTGILYLIDADIRHLKPDAIIEAIIQHHRIRGYSTFAMETNQFQQFLSDELKRRSALVSVYVPVEDVHQSTDKDGRIQSLQPLIRSGKLRLSRRHVELLKQLRQFPMGAHNDGPDALHMAVSVTQIGPPSLSVISFEDDESERPYDPLSDESLWTPIG